MLEQVDECQNKLVNKQVEKRREKKGFCVSHHDLEILENGMEKRRRRKKMAFVYHSKIFRS